jgi:hypothetical protein
MSSRIFATASSVTAICPLRLPDALCSDELGRIRRRYQRWDNLTEASLLRARCPAKGSLASVGVIPAVAE